MDMERVSKDLQQVDENNNAKHSEVKRNEETMVVNNKRICYTVSELAEILPLGKNSLYRLVKSKDFPKITVGKKILIPVAGLAKWMEANTETNF
jgi:excisionase family DNA binding protein